MTPGVEMTRPRPKTRQEIEALARQTLVDHGLLSVPVNPVAVAKKLGVRVLNAVFSEPKYSGIVARRNGESTILVKESDSPVRKRFTVAHEVGHALLHLSDERDEIIDSDTDLLRTTEQPASVWTEARRREYEANCFAAGLLMPEPETREIWEQLESGHRSAFHMARIFQVSDEAMGLRLQQLNLI